MFEHGCSEKRLTSKFEETLKRVFHDFRMGSIGERSTAGTGTD